LRAAVRLPTLRAMIHALRRWLTRSLDGRTAARRARVTACWRWMTITVAGLTACATGAGPPERTIAAVAAAAPSAPGTSQADVRTLGSADAPVTIIEFTDLQCPYCARFARDTFPELRRRYVDTGKVHFVSRDLPLSFHPYALPAAVAARCAGEQGRFWEYREALFRGQSRLADAPYDELARRFGLDVPRFAACRNEPAMLARVEDDAAVAAHNGISSTPTFVVGRVVGGQFHGEILPGAQPLDVFVQRIEALLGQVQQ
jgi:protein-disulfide isomerase